jgi:glyoxylate reductase
MSPARAGTARPRVLVTRPTPGAIDVPGAEVLFGPEEGLHPAHRLRDFLASHRPIAAVVTMFHDRVDDAFLDAAGPDLRAVCNFAVGYDNIDVAACARRGVVVTNTPDAVTEGAADMAWTLLLAAARRLPEADEFARSGAWARRGPLGMSDFVGLPIAGRTLHIVGAGRIGYAVAVRSLGWGMKVLYSSRTRKPAFEFAPLNGRWVEIDEGLREADFVSIHAPLNDSTRHLIDARRLALMKPSAVLVNTSRGPVVDEAALAEAVAAGRLWGAGLDVFEDEPRVHPGLAASRRVAMAPHIGSASTHSRGLMAEKVSENVRAVMEGREAPNLVTA